MLLPLVGMHTLNYNSIPLNCIAHVQVLRLQHCLPSCPAALLSPLTVSGHAGATGRHAMLNYISIPHNFIVPVQVLRLLNCLHIASPPYLHCEKGVLLIQREERWTRYKRYSGYGTTISLIIKIFAKH